MSIQKRHLPQVRNEDITTLQEQHAEESSPENSHENSPESFHESTPTNTPEDTNKDAHTAPEEESTTKPEPYAIAKSEPRDLSKPLKRTPPARKNREERELPPLENQNITEEPQTDATSADTEHVATDEAKSAPIKNLADTHVPEQEEEKPMSLMEHLGELRTRLVRSFIAVGLAFVVCYSFAEQLFAELCKPLINALPEGSKLIFTALPEAFFVYLQVGLVAAVFVASPFLFYQIWAFVAPGLYDEEKKYMIPMAVISAVFFIGGASFCFLVVFPYAFSFFVGFASEDIAAMPSLKEYLGFALKLLIAFGLIFEMPLFTFFLARIGLVTAKKMRSIRRYAVLCIFIVAAILTPPDVISQLLMAMPMMLLYELSIFVAVMFGKKKNITNETEEA